MKKAAFVFTVMGIAILAFCGSVLAGSVQKDVPEAIDPSAKYIFYMHGFAVEQGAS